MNPRQIANVVCEFHEKCGNSLADGIAHFARVYALTEGEVSEVRRLVELRYADPESMNYEAAPYFWREH